MQTKTKARELSVLVEEHRARAARAQKAKTKAPPSPLAGKLFDENGQPPD
jgi:hypothetical protein